VLLRCYSTKLRFFCRFTHCIKIKQPVNFTCYTPATICKSWGPLNTIQTLTELLAVLSGTAAVYTVCRVKVTNLVLQQAGLWWLWLLVANTYWKWVSTLAHLWAEYRMGKKLTYTKKADIHQQKSTCMQLQWLNTAFTSLCGNLEKLICSKLPKMLLSPTSLMENPLQT